MRNQHSNSRRQSSDSLVFYVKKKLIVEIGFIIETLHNFQLIRKKYTTASQLDFIYFLFFEFSNVVFFRLSIKNGPNRDFFEKKNLQKQY